MLTWRTTALAALAIALVPGCSTTSAPPGTSVATSPAAMTTPSAAPKAARGEEAALESVPWDEVGSGWTLATWSLAPYVPGGPPAAATTLYLVDPEGGRYPITTFPPSQYGGPRLIDWSGDGQRAVFFDVDAKPSAAILVDLHTGTQTTVPVQGTPAFTLPSGKAMLITNDINSPGETRTLERVDLTGKRELLYPTDKLGSPFGGSFLSTPDGTQLLLGTDAGVVVVGNDGTVVRTLSMPGLVRCSPLRWWDDEPGATALVHCGSDLNDQPQLWLMPIDGGAPTALTAPYTGGADLNAWKVPAGTFVQTASQCGDLVFEKLNADGTTSRVTVPDIDAKKSIEVIGVSSDDLILRGFHSCAAGMALIDYNPAANTSTVLLGPPLNGGSVVNAVIFPQ